MCWGKNTNGQLGVDTGGADATSPMQVSGLTSGVIALAGGDAHTCALLSGGAVKCWGSNASGQVGNGTTTDSTVPVQVLASGATSITAGHDHTCATTSSGAYCWGLNVDGQLGTGTTTNSTTPVQVSGLTSSVTSVVAAGAYTCARTSTGGLQCWGNNSYGVISATSPAPTSANPQTASYGYTNGALIGSQASVLVRQFAAAAGSTISGHVTPIAYTMVNNTTGNQALMVTYDPLAAAAAMFIEQYKTHVDACNATTSEAITEQQQQAGTYLWACSNANAKSAYLSGMQTLLAGARSYLFGQSDGCVRNSTVGGVACGTSDKITVSAAHFPYTFVVPDYTSSAYNGDPTVTTGTGAYYYTPLSNALATYRDGLLASSASPLHRTLQLAGIAKFDASTDGTTGATGSAIITTRVKRSGAFGTACVTH